MTRPQDLPMPVKPHNAHEIYDQMLKYECSPGPARYSITNERNQKLVSFARSGRFRDHQSVPGDSMSSNGRPYQEHPGPIYTPKWMDTKLSISFSRESHLSTPKSRDGTSGSSVNSVKNDERIQYVSSPGPGQYDVSLKWDKSVTIPSSGRDGGWYYISSTPGPGAYSNEKPKIRNRCARIVLGSPVLRTDKIEPVHDTLSMEEMDRALSATRHRVAGVSFPKAGRSLSAKIENIKQLDSSLNKGYDVEIGEKLLRPNIHGGKFGKATRQQDIKADDVILRTLPSVEIESTKSLSPTVHFSKAQYRRGGASDDYDGPGVKYTPLLDATHPGPKGILKWHRSHFDRQQLTKTNINNNNNNNNDEEVNNNGVDFIEAKSTLNGPSVSFPKSQRPELLCETWRSNPGPGHYTPMIDSVVNNPKRIGFSRAKRDLVVGHTGEGSGVIYPDYTVTRPKAFTDIVMCRDDRKLKVRDQSCGSTTLYSPCDDQTRKRGRSAILYLTG